MSKSVDERVVSMSFDNSKFDKNVQKSIETLAQLKSSLKFDKTTDSFAGLNQSAKGVDLSGIEKSLDRIKSRFSTTGIIGMTVISNLTTSAMNMAKKSTRWFTQGVVQGGLARAKNIEQAKFQLKGLKVEWDSIKDDINYAVDGTAYGLDAAAKAASQLVASGVKFGKQSDDMKTSLRAISGVAAMTNSTYEDTARIFTTVAGNGRLMGDQLNQLASRGLNAAATLGQYGKYAGKTEKEIRELVTKGQISFQDFSDAMDEAFGKHAQAANKTLEGAFSNTKAALGRIGADFITPFIAENGPLVQFFNRLKNIIDNIRKAMIPLESEFLDPALKAMEKVNKWMVNLDHATGSTYRRFANLLGMSDSSGKSVEKFNKMLETTLKSNGVDIDMLVKKYGNLADAVDSLSSVKRRDALTKSFFSVGNIFNFKNKNSVNRRLNDFLIIVDNVEEKYGKLTNTNNKAIKALKKQGYSYKELSGLIENFAEESGDNWDTVTKKQLKALGASKEQISLFRNMQAAAKKSGMSMWEYTQNLASMEEHGTGGALILKTLKNAFLAITKPLLAIKDAFFNVFGIKNNETAIYNMLYSIEQLSEGFVMSEETAKNLTKTFEGLFTVLKWAATIAGGALRVGMFLLSKFLHITGGGLLSITADLSNAVTTIDNKINDLIGTLSKLILKNKHVAKATKSLNSTFIPMGKSVKAHLIDNHLLAAIYDYLTRKMKNFIEQVKLLAKTSLELSGFNSVLVRMQARAKMIFAVFNRSFPKFHHNMEILLGMFNNATFTDQTIDRMVDFIKNNLIAELKDPEKWRVIGRMIGEGLRIGLNDGFEALKEATKLFVTGFIELVKALLGIHSPSTVMIEIGNNIMQGLIIGIEQFFGLLIQTIGNIVEQAQTTFAGMDFGKYFAFGGAFAMIVMLNKITKSIESILSPLSAANKLIGSTSKLISTFSKVIKKFGNGLVVLMYATAISELALSLYLLASVPWQGLAAGVAAIGALAVIMGVLIWSLSKIEPKEFVIRLDALALFVGTMAALILALTAAFVAIAMLKTDQVVKGAIGILAISVAMGIILLAVGKWGKDLTSLRSAIGIAAVMITFAEAMFIIASSMLVLSTVNEQGIKAGIVIMAALIGLIAIVGALNRTSTKFGDPTGIYDYAAFMLAFGVSIKLIASAIHELGKLTPEELKQGSDLIKTLVVMIGVVIVLASLLSGNKTKIISKATTGSNNLAALFGSIALLIAAIAASIKIIGMMDPDKVIQGLNAIAMVVAMIMILMITAKCLTGTGDVDDFGKMFAGIGVAFTAIATAVRIIAGIKDGELLKALGAITMITLLIAGLIVVCKMGSSYSNFDGKDILLMLLGVSMAIVAISASLALLSMIKWTSLAKAVAAMTVVMGGIIGILWMAGKVGQNKRSVACLKSLSIMIITLSVTMVALSLMRPEKVLTAALSLVAVMGALVGVMYMATQMKKGIPALTMLAVIIGLLGAVFIGLSAMPLKKVAGTGLALVGVLLALSVAMLAASKLVDTIAKATIKIMAVMTLVVAAIIGLMWVVQKLNIQANTKVFETIGKLLLTMAGCMIILTPVGFFAAEAIAGASALMLFIVELMALIVAIGGLSEEYPSIKKFLDTGLDMLIRMANGLGKMIGSFFGGAFAGLMGGDLEGLGTSLSAFMNSMTPFINSIKGLDGGAAEGAKALAETVAILTGTSVFNKLATLLTGGSNYTDLSIQFTYIGKAINDFVHTLDDISADDIGKIEIAAKAAKALVKVAEAIPNSGGLLSGIVGDNKLSDFTPQLAGLAEAIVTFANKSASVNKDTVEKIRLIGKATQELAKINPGNSGGLKQLFTGKVNYEKFGNQLGGLSRGIQSFSKNSADVEIAFVQNGANAAALIVGVVNKLDIEKKDFKTFVNNVDDLGKGIKNYSKYAAGTDLEAMKKANNELRDLVSVLNSMSSLDGNEANSFRETMKAIGEVGIDDAVEAINNSKVKLSDAINGLFDGVNQASSNTNGIDFSYQFVDSLETALGVFDNYNNSFAIAGARLATSFSREFRTSKAGLGNNISISIKKMIDDINAKYPKQMKASGVAVSKAFSSGFTSSKSNINGTMKKTLSSCKQVIDDYKTKFGKSGGNLTEGFANGVKLKTYIAEAKAKYMAKKAKKAADDALNIKSPSREMMKTGRYFVEGFANGITRNIESATNSSTLMSNQSMNSVISAVGTINDTINNGVNPTPSITPVMDMNTLNSDINGVSSMLNSDYRYDLGANVDVNTRGTDDIAQAIANKVREAIVSALDTEEDVNIYINSTLECSGEAIAKSSAQYLAPELNKIMVRSNRRAGKV